MVSPRLGFTKWVDGQAMPETTGNELALRIEQGANLFIAKDKDGNSPPGSPAEGDCYVVGSSPTGAWSTHAKNITFCIGGAWGFIVPIEGTRCYMQDEDAWYQYSGSAWVIDSGGGGGGGSVTTELDIGPPTTATLSTELKSATAFTASASDVSNKGLLLSLNPTGTGNKVIARIHALSGAKTITCRLRQTPPQHDENGESGLYIDSGSGDSIRWFMMWDGMLYCQRWNALENWNVNICSAFVTYAKHIWLRMVIDGSANISLQYSFDGAFWKVAGTDNVTSRIGAYSRAGVFSRNAVNGTTSGVLFPYYNEA